MSLAIDVAIGLAFLYLLLALVVTTVQELLATWLGWRAQDLYAAIEGMLRARATDESQSHAQKLLKSLFGHPLLRNLRKDPTSMAVAQGPSYIPSKTFALALLDVLRHEKKASEASGVSDALVGAAQVISEIQIPAVRSALEAMVDDARRSANRIDDEVLVVTNAIETWFNDRMARAAGWYKRKSQGIALLLAAAVVAFANADSLSVATTLWHDSATRDALVADARSFHDTNVASEAATSEGHKGIGESAKRDDPIGQLEQLPLPLGWSTRPNGAGAWALKLVGLLLSALAVSLGSGFWFDLLGRVLQLRGTGPRVSSATGRTDVEEA